MLQANLSPLAHVSPDDKAEYSRLIAALVKEVDFALTHLLDPGAAIICLNENGDTGTFRLESDRRFWDTTPLEEWLEEYEFTRFTFLNNGAFSLVFLDTTLDAVLKISLVEDDVANLYWEFCQKNQAPYLPSIIAMGAETHELFDRSLVVDWCVQPRYLKNTSYNVLAEQDAEFARIADSLFPSLGEWAKSLPYKLDLHQDNVMQDSQGNLVVIDAICQDPLLAYAQDSFN